jgi:hypothetical protein
MDQRKEFYTKDDLVRAVKEHILDRLRAQETARVIAAEAESGRNEELTRLQDEIAESMDRYSRELGWGLTGYQPECWSLLDAAVSELVRLREESAQNARLVKLFRKILLAKQPFDIGRLDLMDVFLLVGTGFLPNPLRGGDESLREGDAD